MLNRNLTMKSVQLALLVACSLIFVVFVTGNARTHRPPHYTVSGTIRWKTNLGVIPKDPGSKVAAANPCLPFFAAAVDPGTGQFIAHTESGGFVQAPNQGDYYVCRYSMTVPANTKLYIRAGMGSVDHLPAIDANPYLLTAPWIGVGAPRPPKGTVRAFKGGKYVTLSGRNSSGMVNFEMIYNRDSDPGLPRT